MFFVFRFKVKGLESVPKIPFYYSVPAAYQHFGELRFCLISRQFAFDDERGVLF